MKRLIALLFLLLGVCAVPARAALVYDGYATGPGGLSTPYPAVNPEVFAGLIEFSSGILAMSNDPSPVSHVGESWSMTNFSFAEVQAGAPVRFTPAQYARAGWFLEGMLTGFVADNVQDYPSLRAFAETRWGNEGSAFINMTVWDIMSSTSCPVSITSNGCSDIDTFNWSQTMAVASGGPGRDEYLVPLASQNLTLGPGTIGTDPVVPVPPAFWLLGSGLLGLIGVARRRLVLR